MTWCVCSTRSGFMFVLTREDREAMLSILMKLNMGVGSYVLKVFDNKEDAVTFMENIKCVDYLIESL